MTAGWVGAFEGEHFALKNHGAQDVRGYDVIKDIGKRERFVAAKQGWNGVFVAITNDPSFWRPVTHGRLTNADAFRIYEGVMLAGTPAWGPNTGPGTMKNREAAIELAGAHLLSGGTMRASTPVRAGCSGRWSLRCHPRRELGGGRRRCDAPSLSAPRDPRRNYRTETSACGDEMREAG